MTQPPADIYAALTAAGFDPAAATTMTAISLAESGGNPTARGDLRLQDTIWGPSYGLFQIRTLKADTGRGTDRDIAALASIPVQARAAYDISRGGTDFTAWSTWTSKAYQRFLGTAVSASGGQVTDPTPATQASLTDPSTWVAGARPLLFETLFVLLGLGLVGFGLTRVFAPQIAAAKKAATKAGKAALTVAAV